MEDHQQLIECFKAAQKAIDKSKTATIVLEVIMVGIVVWMKAIQTAASLTLNIAAASAVFLLLCWHFWGFYPRRDLHEEAANIVLRGFEMEKENPLINLLFFKKYMEKFSTIGEILRMALFDLILIYFCSVSMTQLLQAINPEIVAKMLRLTPVSNLIIFASLGWAHYQPIRPLANLKKTMRSVLHV